MGVLFFDESFDGGAWPGPYGSRATAGELWLGRSGLVGTLEAQVGLTHDGLGSAGRLGEVVRALEQHDGFWSQSAEADALATAQEVVRLYDTLRLHGWKGEAVSPRLLALHRAFVQVSPSMADRLELLVPALTRTTDVRWPVRLFEPLSASPLRVREVLQAVSRGLTEAEPRPLDLASLRSRLQLVRPYGPLVAAELVAQALAATPDEPTLIIGADALLDAALRRHGLPTTGAASEAVDNALGELLPLIIELGLAPADPFRALEFLTVPVSPIRRDVARRLVRALQSWPAVGSEAWDQELAKATEAFTAQDATSVRERLATYLDATVAGDQQYPVEVLHRRRTALMTWLQGRLQGDLPENVERQYAAAVAQVVTFGQLVEMTGRGALTLAQVRRFLEQSREAMPAPSAWPAEAGLVALDGPGSLVAPTPRRIVWWNFSRSAFPSPRRLPLEPRELVALREAGLDVPTPARLAARLMARARRPLQGAEGALWLVCPRHEASGDEAAPHPVWDEVVGALDREAEALVVPEPRIAKPPKAVRRTLLVTPQPVLEWQTSTPLERREVESPSSIEHFLGCSFAWSLRYVANLKPGTTATLDTSQRLLGSLAHHILLERVLKRAHESAAAAGEYAVKVLMEEGPRLAAPLFQPGADAELLFVKEATRKAAEALQARVLEGLPVLDTETEFEGKALGTKFKGAIDLLLGTREKPVIVDLKWSGLPYRRHSLESGTALQLAAYGELLRQAGYGEPAIGYFIIQSQAWLSSSERLVTSAASRVSDAGVDTWKVTKRAHDAAWKTAKTGALTAPGTHPKPPRHASVEEGELTLPPPCGFCDYAGLCGQRYGRVEVEDEEG